MKTPRRARSSNLLLAAPALALAAPAARADIIYTSINGSSGLTVSYQGNRILFNPLNGYANIVPVNTTPPTTDFVLIPGIYFIPSNQPPPFLARGHAAGSIAATQPSPGYYLLDKFTLGQPIGSSSTFFHYGYFFYSGSGPFPPNVDTSGYVGLQLSNNDYAWALIERHADNSFTLFSMAYDNTGAPINAGAVPEPADSAFAAALLAGSLAAYRARQRRKSPKTA